MKAEVTPGTGLVHAAVRERVFAPYQRLVREALERGVARGELPPRPVSPAIGDIGPAMLIHRYFLSAPAVSDEEVAAIVDAAILPALRR
jgi:hypothetical protein